MHVALQNASVLLQVLAEIPFASLKAQEPLSEHPFGQTIGTIAHTPATQELVTQSSLTAQLCPARKAVAGEIHLVFP